MDTPRMILMPVANRIVELTDIDIERFHSSYTVDGAGCWRWDRRTDRDGYGCFKVVAGLLVAHRVSFAIAGEDLDPKLTLDHLCRVRECVNPEHLEQVTTKVNTRRSPNTVASIHAAKTHCVNGHELAGDNVYREPKFGGRSCKTCHRAACARYRARHAA